jgi:hypothetical protein
LHAAGCTFVAMPDWLTTAIVIPLFIVLAIVAWPIYNAADIGCRSSRSLS